MEMHFDLWIRVEAVGYSGSIWLFWKDNITTKIITTHRQFIHLEVTIPGKPPWLFSLIYARLNPGLRKCLRQELHKGAIGQEGPWLVAGDFNSVLLAEETSNPGRLDPLG